MERLNLGPKDLKKENKKLIYGRMTGWGQTGPRSKQAGHDLNYIGLNGALHYASQAGDIPQTIPTVVGDIGGGSLYLIIGNTVWTIKSSKYWGGYCRGCSHC